MLATKILRLGSAIAPFVLIVACMYNPKPKNGTQECYQGRCVDGYVCGYDNLCYTPDALPVPPGTGGTTPVGHGGTTQVGNGGVTGHGGVTGSGGVTGYGGTTSTGGTTTPPNSGNLVTFANYQAQGAMTGYGWVALGSLDTVTDPTCRSPAGAITSSVSCMDTAWSTTTAYCLSGYLPAVLSSTDYTNNWGIQVGVNSTPVTGGILGQSFTSVSVSLTGSPQTGLRIVVHRAGDSDSTTYCAAMSPGLLVASTSFNTACWDSTGATGTKLTAADVPNLDHVGVQVSSGPSAVTISNLCLTGITFAK